MCLIVLGFYLSFVGIVGVEAIAFCVSKTTVSEWRSSSSWFRTQALGQSNFLLSLFGLFFIFIFLCYIANVARFKIFVPIKP
jgi:uncharacterized membrane protein YdjX (TVP38/TMEM64 family)